MTPTAARVRGARTACHCRSSSHCTRFSKHSRSRGSIEPAARAMARTTAVTLVLAGLLVLALPAVHAVEMVTTVAGPVPCSSCYGGDFAPSVVAISPDGCTAVITGGNHHTVYTLDIATEVMTCLAGDCSAGGGDGNGEGFADGQGTAALFAYPVGVDIAPDGTYALIADLTNHRIRRIDLATAAVTTVAGGQTGQNQYGQPIGGDSDGVGTAALLNRPNYITISPDGTYAWFSDSGNHKIRRLDLATYEVTTVAGSGVAGITCGTATNLPSDVASGVETVDCGLHSNAGLSDGTGTAAVFGTPTGIAFSPDGLFALVTEGGYGNSQGAIRKIVMATAAVTTIAANMPNGDWRGFGEKPVDISISADGTYALIVAWSSAKILRLDIATNAISDFSGYGNIAQYPPDPDCADCADCVDDCFAAPPTGCVWTDWHCNHGGCTMADGGCVFSNAMGSTARFNLPNAVSIHESAAGSFALVADTNNGRVRMITGTPTFSATSGIASCGAPPTCDSLTCADNGNGVAGTNAGAGTTCAASPCTTSECCTAVADITCTSSFDCSGEATDTVNTAASTVCATATCAASDCCEAPPVGAFNAFRVLVPCFSAV